MHYQLLLEILDIVGTFAFAVSGVTAAIQRRLDIFGVIFLGFVAACGGGILRDVLIGATPPASLVAIKYIAIAVATSLLIFIRSEAFFARFNHPVLLFDAIGLSLFCVVGAQKTLTITGSPLAAVLLGVITGVGGGLLRDIILNRIPFILEKEIYASAALLGSSIVVAVHMLHWPEQLGAWVAMAVCFALRILSLRFNWHLFRAP